MFSDKLKEILSSKLNQDQFIKLSIEINTIKSQVAKFELCEALQGQFRGKKISRQEFDELNSKPTTFEKAKNLGNNVLDLTVNKLFNNPLIKIYGRKYVEHNTTARNKNTFKQRIKELKQVVNSHNGVGM
jgi:hypothetical protein